MHFLLLLSLFFTACIHKSKNQKKETSAKVYFDKAVQYKGSKNYIKALEHLRELRKQFFYSRYNQKALLLTADIYFAQEKYSEAAQSYEKHLGLYPETETAYVLYQIGLSYQEQLPHRPDHDLGLSVPALEAFNKLLNLKESSPYKQKAEMERQKILNKKADKELKAILFYKKQGWNKAAFKRVQYFIENYPDSPLMPKALLEGFFLAKILNEDSESFKKRLIDNYPESGEVQSVLEETKTSIFMKWKQKLL